MKDKEQLINCPCCGWVNVTLLTDQISGCQIPELLDFVIEGSVNRYHCVNCGHKSFMNVPLHVSGELFSLQFLPPETLENKAELDRINAERGRGWGNSINIVFSMEELSRQVLFHLNLSRRRNHRQIVYKQYKVPEAVLVLIRGRYKKRKLKNISYVSTFFEPDQDYTQSEVDEIIRLAMSEVDRNQLQMDTTDFRIGLCDLGFLKRTADGSRYWKTELEA